MAVSFVGFLACDAHCKTTMAVGNIFVGLFRKDFIVSVPRAVVMVIDPSKKSITVVGKASYCLLLQWLQRGHKSVRPLYMTTQ